MRTYPKKMRVGVLRDVVMEHVTMTNKLSLNFFKHPNTFRLRVFVLKIVLSVCDL